MSNSLIVKAITPDGLVGFDRSGNLVCARGDGERDRGHFSIVHDVRGLTCEICLQGWEMTCASFGDQHRWDLTENVVHRSCLARHAGFIERRTVYQAVCNARIRFKTIVTVANGYHGDTDAWGKWMPWYSIDLLDHPFRLVVGHRKRVWELAVFGIWRETGRERTVDKLGAEEPRVTWHQLAEEEFADEKVTKSFDDGMVMLHAWGDTKLREYLVRLAKVGGIGRTT